MAAFFKKIGLKQFCEERFPIQDTSPNSLGVFPKILGFFLTLLAGGKRFAHLLYLGEGREVLAPLFDAKRLPAASSTITRFFGAVNGWPKRKALQEAIWNYLFGVIPWSKYKEDDLNLDSHVITRYGNQSGAKKGVNKKKPGRKSHHPLLAFLNHSEFVVNLLNRAGNAVSATNALSFFEQTLERIAGRIVISGVFADAGFYLIAFIELLEKKMLKYVIAAVLRHPLQERLVSPELTWEPLLDHEGKPTGYELAEFGYEPKGWGKPRRHVAIREKVRPGKEALGKQLSLFPEMDLVKDYRYRVHVTNREEDMKTVWDRYRQRADDENRLKELLYDFGLDGFCLKRFFPTEAAMLANVFLYNLFNLFRREVLPPSEIGERASTVRYKYWTIPAIAGRQGNQLVLRLGVASKGLRAKIRYLFDRIQRGFSWCEVQSQCN